MGKEDDLFNLSANLYHEARKLEAHKVLIEAEAGQFHKAGLYLDRDWLLQKASDKAKQIKRLQKQAKRTRKKALRYARKHPRKEY